MVVKNPFSWLAHRCTPLNKNPGGWPFLWSALVMSPQWLALLEPFILSQPIGHDKVPMFFWGPLSGPGVVRKIRRVASLRDNKGFLATQPPILFFLKWPWSWWVPGSRSTKGPHHNNWKLGRRQTKGSHSNLETDPAKKDIIFCDGGVFFLDRGLLMGAISTTWNRVSFSTYILFITKLQKKTNP